jgi:hypothetical protein
MFLIINNSLHHKNKIGLEMMLDFLKIKYKYGSIDDIKDSKIIYSPSEPIDMNKYYDKDKLFIFGPHFSVFPNNKISEINTKLKNIIYIQPSDWVLRLWEDFNLNINLRVLSFPVDTNKFNEDKLKIRDKVFIYFKRRKPEELNRIINFLNNKKIDFKIFDYVKRYNENEYLKYLHESKYGIILDAHESQGFALEEAMSSNVPLLVWNIKDMSQEYGINYPKYKATTIPYWDERCGEYFYEENELDTIFNKFINNLEKYRPREFIMDNLSVSKCAERLNNIII